MKKLVIGFIFAVCFVLLVPQSGLANDNEEKVGESIKVVGEIDIIEEIILEDGFEAPDCIACVNYNHIVTTLSGPTIESQKHVRWLTSSWTKVSQYKWSETQSATATVSTELGISAMDISTKLGVARSVTSTYSVEMTIPASSSKASKLAYRVDFDKRYVKVDEYLGSTLVRTRQGNHFSPREDTYLMVVYQ